MRKTYFGKLMECIYKFVSNRLFTTDYSQLFNAFRKEKGKMESRIVFLAREETRNRGAFY